MTHIEIPKFVKWAGGKTQLIAQFKPLFPKIFNHYFEPFVGGGAVFFYVMQQFKPQKIMISDINAELINTYKIIRDDHEPLIQALKQHQHHHQAKGKAYYLTIRALHPHELSPLERAARMIYLNKTCFNGLYRVNAKGQFNVPMGAYKNPDIVQEAKLNCIAQLLQSVTIKELSFEHVVELAKKDDFIYFDPPYYPLEKGKSFTAYTQNVFLEAQQQNLVSVFKQLDKKGCLVMLSNSDTQFIKDLYSDYHIHWVRASRMINCNANKRGKINELVITNY
ncbi:MAG: DNA adenine methylase [Pseudomonadota bacterium]|nr:DNA adenine methylase [Pseudomonadota bacterium]